MLTWMAYTVLVGGLVALAATGLERAGRLLGLPGRFVWAAALLVVVALAALGPVRSVRMDPSEALTAVEASAASHSGEASVIRPSGWRGRVSSAAAHARQALSWPLRAVAARSGGTVDTLLGVVWVAMSIGVMALGIGTVLRYRAARRDWLRREICGVGVRVAPRAGPAVLGLIHPEIVVPVWLLKRPSAQQRLVVLHEQEHLRSGDGWTLAVGWMAAALIPWSPLSWWMLSRLRLAVELDCDARVLRRDVSRQAYGSMLIDVTERGVGLVVGAPALGGTSSTLERRILAMTTSTSRPAPFRAAALAAVGALALIAACDTPLPTSEEIDELDGAAALTRAEQLGVADGATYFLDGKEVSAEELQAIGPDRLARVEIQRGVGREDAVIHVWSHAADAVAAGDGDVTGGHAEAASAPRLRITSDREAGEPAASIVPAHTPHGPGKPFEGLVFIDGVQVELDRLNALKPSEIERIEVVKGEAAARAHSDARARHGIIRVTTRSGAGNP